jgi:hypothetical protein
MNARVSTRFRPALRAALCRATLGAVVLGVALAAGCKTPRTPHRVAENDVSGTWTAQSRDPVPLGWSFRLDQGDAGKLSGSGTLNDGNRVSPFSIDGIRGPYEITMTLHRAEGAARFDGSVTSIDMIVGQVAMDGDTIKLTLQRN